MSPEPGLTPNHVAPVVASLPVALAVYDAAHRLVFCNPAVFVWQGLDPALAPPGTPFAEIVRIFAWNGAFGPGEPETLARTVLAFDRTRAMTRLVRSVSDRTVQMESRPLPDGGFLTCATDVTGLVRAEAEASGRACQLETVLARLHGGVALFDDELRLQLSNPAYERLIGLPGGLVRPGLTHRDIIALQVERGEVEAEDHAAIADRMAAARHRVETRQRARRSGEVMRFQSQPMPDGGCLIEVDDVTALKRAEEEARRRAGLLDGVLEAMPHGICVYGPDRRVAMFNAAYARIMDGAPVSLGDLLEDIVARRVQAGEFSAVQAEDVLRRQFGRDGPASEPRQRLRPNGTAIETRTARLADGGHISVVTDVTALHRAEAEARARAAMLDGVLAALPHGVCVYGPDRRVALVNDAYLRIMEGASVRIGEHVEELAARRVAAGEFTAEHAALTLSRKFTLAADGRDEMQRTRPNGTVIAIRDATLPDGGHISVVTDVTAQHRAEAEARHRAAMLEAMLATIQHGIIMYGPDRRVIATNAKTAELTGMPADRLVPGRLMDELLQEQVLRGQISPATAAAMQGYDRSRPLRYERSRADGRVLEVTSDPTPDGGHVVTYSDVTDDRRIRAELERARVAAEAGSEAKSRFLATMSHELRTPLNAVIGFSEALVGERDATRIEEYAGAINEAGRHLLLLIDDILDVARSQTGALQIADAPVLLGPLLEAAARAVTAAAGRAGLTLTVDLPPGLPALIGDARRLHQVLSNLLSNAVKFTPAGGRVTLSARVSQAGLSIRVADTGIGIAPEDRERVFEPFTQVDSSLARRFHGSGLGLYLARTLADALGGSLALEDPVGPGTVAVLRFPPSRLVASA
jgi:signal transduction histidine kinase